VPAQVELHPPRDARELGRFAPDECDPASGRRPAGAFAELVDLLERISFLRALSEHHQWLGAAFRTSLMQCARCRRPQSRKRPRSRPDQLRADAVGRAARGRSAVYRCKPGEPTEARPARRFHRGSQRSCLIEPAFRSETPAARKLFSFSSAGTAAFGHPNRSPVQLRPALWAAARNFSQTSHRPSRFACARHRNVCPRRPWSPASLR